MRPDQSESTKCPLLQHKDGQRRVEVGLLRQLLVGSSQKRTLALKAFPSWQQPHATETHNVHEADHLFEVRVKFKVFDFFRLQLMSCTLHSHEGTGHLKQLHPLQFTQTPEKHLSVRARADTHTQTSESLIETVADIWNKSAAECARPRS